MSTLVKGVTPDVQVEVFVEGSGPDVVLLPSALRPATDFALLQADLTAAGYRSLAINIRGAGRSSGPTEGIDAEDMVDDVASVVGSLCQAPVHIVGHALGNILARMTASYRPELIKTVTVAPAGGHRLVSHPVPPEVLRSFVKCHDESLPDDERLHALEVAFFAPGNDGSSWLRGWQPAAQPATQALLADDPERWWRGGDGPMLIMQPRDDAMTGPEVGLQTAADLGSRATYIEIPNCAHAFLPEQPALIAGHLIEFLRAHP